MQEIKTTAKGTILQTVVVIGTSGGIGSAVADELESTAKYSVHRFGRSTSIPLDLTDERSIAAAADWLKQGNCTPDVVFVATGLLHQNSKGPEKSISQLNADWMIENYRINAVGPALIAKHFLPLMPRDRRICLAVLSARVGSISDNRLGGWHSYRASKAALNMLIRNIAIEWHRRNPQSVIVGLHPGTVETNLSAPFRGNPDTERFSPNKAAKLLLATMESLGPEHSGRVFSYNGEVIAP